MRYSFIINNCLVSAGSGRTCTYKAVVDDEGIEYDVELKMIASNVCVRVCQPVSACSGGWHTRTHTNTTHRYGGKRSDGVLGW
jgi:hypothetical protein